MIDNELLVLLGTDPREWSASGDALGRLFANASGAALGRLCANASGDDLGRLCANASGDALGRLHEIHAGVPKIDKPYSALKAEFDSGRLKLNMGQWHTCKTTHCIGGSVVHYAGKAGYDLEKKVGGDTAAAAALILRKSRPDAPLPNFYASNEAALAFIEARAAEEELVPA